ncbi:hypothetical protein J5N97_026574 [Dioscorea zingiberensis]|uniref:Aldehyde dehydrogenase domain-containing protein n=1 Tax=Dioscorea zingiberensis TaxID=325984 RepID=A0A9D5C2C6_9LILI|nr:hypothetical protein J5N97_026574 [Dioscorea zingiberensis]
MVQPRVAAGTGCSDFCYGTRPSQIDVVEKFNKVMRYIRSDIGSGATLDEMEIVKDEIFGHVQSILKVQAGAFTNNIDNMSALRAGTIWVNCFDVFDAAIPFGGYKMSGHGREKGMDNLKNYLQIKAVVTPLKNPAALHGCNLLMVFSSVSAVLVSEQA